MSVLPTRQLGKDGPMVSSIGLGCMGLSAAYGKPVDDPIKVLEKSIDSGCTFFDTADIYMDNEELLAKVLKDRRKEVFLCSKFGITSTGVRGDAGYVREACERSLKRLGVDCIDLFYMHRMDPKTPIEDTMGELSKLVKEGKIKHIGLSECSADTLRRACKVHHVAAVQMEYSPWTLDMEHNGLGDACKELGVAIVAYSPVGRGFLTGRYKSPEDFDADDWRRTNPRFQGENFQKNLKIVSELERIAAKKNCTAAQLCLAWVMHQGDHIIPIPGTTSLKNLESNLASLKVQITKEDDDEIRKVMADIPAVGTRYPDSMMTSLNQ